MTDNVKQCVNCEVQFEGAELDHHGHCDECSQVRQECSVCGEDETIGGFTYHSFNDDGDASYAVCEECTRKLDDELNCPDFTKFFSSLSLFLGTDEYRYWPGQVEIVSMAGSWFQHNRYPR